MASCGAARATCRGRWCFRAAGRCRAIRASFTRRGSKGSRSSSSWGSWCGAAPFGRAGDFVAARESSQMFGELIGLWAAAVWQAMGAPAALHLVELGPGRGTLMADALRAAKVVPAFRAALDVHLVETSPALRRIQQERLSGFAPADWHTDVAPLPAGPSIVIANEFFDALPVHQAVRGARGWHERMVGLDADGQLMFALHPDAMPGFEAGLPDTL